LSNIAFCGIIFVMIRKTARAVENLDHLGAYLEKHGGRLAGTYPERLNVMARRNIQNPVAQA
jgi:hypothetical protein